VLRSEALGLPEHFRFWEAIGQEARWVWPCIDARLSPEVDRPRPLLNGACEAESDHVHLLSGFLAGKLRTLTLIRRIGCDFINPSAQTPWRHTSALLA
jgi:hypothetical protein